MKITCHACDAKYTIADEKVSGRTVKIKCKKCGATIVVNADPAAQGAPAPAGYEQPPPAGDDDGLMATRVAGQEHGGPSITSAEWTVSLGEEERQMSQLQMAEEMQRGVVTGDTYVWKDGMADWLSVSQVPELAALLARAAPQQAYGQAPAPAVAPAPVQDEPHMGLAGTVVMSDSPAISPFAAPRPAAGAPAAVTPTPAAASPGLAPVNQPTTGAAARRANRPAGGSVDVFAAAAEQQQQPENRPKPPTPAGRLGERNENSVLFSLSALTATENAAKGKGPEPEAVVDLGLGNGKGKSSVDDLMNLGGGAIGGPMLAPPPLLAPVVEPPPAPVPVAAPVVAPAVGAMGAMGAMGATPAFEPMVPPKKSKTGLIIGIAVGVVAIGAVGAVMALGGGDAPSGEATATPAGGATSAPAVTSAAPTDTATSAPTTEAPAASGAPAASSAAVAVNDTGGKAPSSGAGGGPGPKPTASASAKPTAEPVASSAPTTAPAPTADPGAGAGRDFNKGAATAALAAAAGAARGCKQPGGPTGSASVRVVFAPSGNVTSANVQGPPFAGTPVGGCIASAFRGARVPAFDGSPVAVTKTVNIN